MRIKSSIKNRLLLCVVWSVVCLFTTHLHAENERAQQTRKQQQILDAQKSQFRAYQQANEQKFNKYQTEQQRKLAEAIAQSWAKIEQYKAKRNPLKPKPTIQPSVIQAKKPPPQSRIPSAKPKPHSPQTHTNQLLFYGEPLTLPFRPTQVKTQGTGKKRIEHFLLTAADYEQSLYKFITQTQKKLNLDDWAMYLFIKTVAQYIYPNNQDTQRLALWKWMNDIGYDVRIAVIGSNHYRLLLPVTHKLYAMSYVRIAGVPYYMDAPTKHKIYTYQQKVTNARKIDAIHPALTKWDKNKKQIASRNLTTRINGKNHYLLIKYDKRTSALMQDYPQFRLGLYFSLPLSPLLQQSLRTAFSPLLHGKSKKEQATIMLQTIQQAIAYKTDSEQFGIENYLFAEETFAFPYADCEDRSVLYAWLVKNILHVPVIALLYPNHVTTAVQLPSTGESVTYKGKKYSLADPTYIGASIGKSMHPNTTPKVIYASK